MAKNKQLYREKISQMICWGHWFALFNIIFSLILGARYLFVSDWPVSLAGRIYSLSSWIGHFSFIVFSTYLLIIFPLTFLVKSQRLLCLISTIIATAGMTLILIDSAMFSRFHLHLNPVIWELLINSNQSEMARDWIIMVINTPVIFLVEILFITWSWQKIHNFNLQNFSKLLVGLFISAFFTSHLMYVWADANFYRPITMQRSNLPLSYPLTARRFLEKHGLLNAQEYKRRLIQQGNPEAVSVAYPLHEIIFRDRGPRNNLLIITVDGLNETTMAQALPNLMLFADNNVRFSQHFSSGSNKDLGLFGLFYGISPSYMDGVLASRIPSALINALTQQGYQFGLFASDGFKSPLYRQALLSNFSLPHLQSQYNAETTNQWQHWLDNNHEDIHSNNNSMSVPWFSYLSLSITDNCNSEGKVSRQIQYKHDASSVDQQINKVLTILIQKKILANTVVIITAQHGVVLEGEDNLNNRQLLQVPLVIHWPGTLKQIVSKLTNHQDVMTTIMQRLLHVSTPAVNYSQGEDLFAAQRYHDWVTSSSNNHLLITTRMETLLLDNNGNYSAWYRYGNQLRNHKPQLALLLQVLTDEKRFIAN